MPKVLFDACVLSNFALSGSLHILKSCYEGYAYMSSFVAAENLRGFLSGNTELDEVRKAVDTWLIETSIEGKEEKTLFETLSVSLGAGEASSIAIAKVRGYTFASDDRAARRDAAYLEVPLTGTLGILWKAVNMKLITLGNGDIILSSMCKKGFYSPVKSLKELKDR